MMRLRNRLGFVLLLLIAGCGDPPELEISGILPGVGSTFTYDSFEIDSLTGEHIPGSKKSWTATKISENAEIDGSQGVSVYIFNGRGIDPDTNYIMYPATGDLRILQDGNFFGQLLPVKRFWKNLPFTTGNTVFVQTLSHDSDGIMVKDSVRDSTAHISDADNNISINNKLYKSKVVKEYVFYQMMQDSTLVLYSNTYEREYWFAPELGFISKFIEPMKREEYLVGFDIK